MQPNLYSQGGVLPIEAPRKPNKCWTNWGPCGIIMGILLVIFGLAMIPIEVSRIIQGSLNRGQKGSWYLYPNYNRVMNANSAQVQAFLPDYYQDRNPDLAQKGIVPYAATVSSAINNKYGGNFPIQDKYLWPWSHAALLFSLVTIAAGLIGILSACRKTYSTVYAFFALSLISFFLSIFLVAYYAVHVYWNKNFNQTLTAASYFSNLDYSLGISMLVVSCFTLVVSSVAFGVACLGAGICLGSKAKLLPIGKARPARQGFFR